MRMICSIVVLCLMGSQVRGEAIAIENLVNLLEDMVVGNERRQRTSDKQVFLPTFLGA